MNEKLKEAVLKDELIIFVGAGVSMPFGFPNWTNLVIGILEELKKEDSRGLDIDYYIKKGDDIDVFEVLDELERRDFKSTVKTLLYKRIKGVNIDEKNFSRIERFWNVSDKIITTNYDKVLERVKPSSVDNFTNFNAFQQAKSLQGSPFLYKIHGDIVDPESCILFSSDYENLYKKDSSDIATLQNFISNKTILFIGFSFEDKFMQNQFDYINELYKGYGKEHFIVLTDNKNLSKFNLKTIEIEDWGESFDSFLEGLIKVKNSKKENIKVDENIEIDISTTDDINYLEGLLDKKKKEFDAASEIDKKKKSKEMHTVSNRMKELFVQKMNVNFQTDIVLHKEIELELLFEDIFKSEKLTSSILNRINNVRDLHSKEHEWYHRSAIVSALACSLINYKKVDPKKIDLLIDFTTDTENKVWQKAVTYLFITLNHLGNKWVRFNNLQPKLESLKSQERIQDALKDIIILLQMNLHNDSVVIKNVFNNEYFKDSPFNYFLPFYKDNPSIEKVYENDTIEDIEGYIDFIYNNPFPDSVKYLLCNKEKNKKTNNDSKISEKEKEVIKRVFDIHVTFNPYLNYVNEFFSFYKFFPSIEKEVKDKTDVVIFNKLENYLLSKVEHHRAVARAFMLEENYNNSITHLKKLIDIKEKDEQALRNLASCYHFVKDIDNELNIRFIIEGFNLEDEENLFSIGSILAIKGKLDEGLTYYDRGLKINDEVPEAYIMRGELKMDLEKYKESIKDFDKAEELGSLNLDLFKFRGRSKLNTGDLIGAMEECNSGLSMNTKLDNDRFGWMILKLEILRKEKKYDKAFIIIEDILKEFDNYFNKNIEDLGRVYGTKAVIYMDMGNEEKFYELLEKSFKNKAEAKWLYDDVKDKYKDKQRFNELLVKYNQSI